MTPLIMHEFHGCLLPSLVLAQSHYSSRVAFFGAVVEDTYWTKGRLNVLFKQLKVVFRFSEKAVGLWMKFENVVVRQQS
jgi:hypothetical protein